MSSIDSRNAVIIRAVDDGEEVNSPVKKQSFWESFKSFFVMRHNFLRHPFQISQK
jgi:hypothetical protein